MTVADLVFRALVAAACVGLLFAIALLARRLSEKPSDGFAVERGQRDARRRGAALRDAVLMSALAAAVVSPVFVWPDVALPLSAGLVLAALAAPTLVLALLVTGRAVVLLVAGGLSALCVAGACWLIAGSMIAVASSPDALELEETMTTVRRLGEAFERWRVDQGLPSPRGLGVEGAPSADSADAEDGAGALEPALDVSPAVRVGGLPPLDPRALSARLVPSHLERLRPIDGWGRPLDLRGALGPAPRLVIRSAGSDGRFSADAYRAGTFDPADHAQDVVWVDGLFVRQPDR